MLPAPNRGGKGDYFVKTTHRRLELYSVTDRVQIYENENRKEDQNTVGKKELLPTPAKHYLTTKIETNRIYYKNMGSTALSKTQTGLDVMKGLMSSAKID